MRKVFKVKKEIEIDGLYTFFYFEHSKDYRYVGERHNFWELVYVDSGNLYAVADNTSYVLSQGNIIFHKPMEFHGMTAVENKPHNVLVVTFETTSPAMNFFSRKVFDLNSKQRKLLGNMLAELKKALGTPFDTANITDLKLTVGQSRAYQIGIAHLEHFLLELMCESSTLETSTSQSSIAKKNVENALADSIKEYLKEQVYSSVSLDDICRKFNMSKSFIYELFKNETGHSPIDYYIGLKIKEAKFMIREGNLNFTEIAEKLGYNSLHHFTRIFKTKEKMSPSMYEKSIK